VAGANKHFVWDRSGSLNSHWHCDLVPPRPAGSHATPHGQRRRRRWYLHLRAYGSSIGRSGTATSPLGYAGEYTDVETGMQDLRARVLPPGDGTVHLTGSDRSNDTKCVRLRQGNPLSSTDPTGLWDWESFA